MCCVLKGAWLEISKDFPRNFGSVRGVTYCIEIRVTQCCFWPRRYHDFSSLNDILTKFSYCGNVWLNFDVKF